MKKILVTGAGGFAGGHIASYLFRLGYDVVGTIRGKKTTLEFPTVVCDLSQDIQMDGDFDVIVHAAGGVPHRNKNFDEFKRANVNTMENLLRFTVKNNVPRVIYLSTIGIYGEFRETLIDEKSDRINQDDYGLTKYMAECMLRATPNLESISLRMPGIIGKGSWGIWFTNTFDKFQRNETVTIYSPDFQTKNFVWIEDLTHFIEVLIERNCWEYDTVNLACNESASIREIVTEMKHLTRSSSEIVVADGKRAPFCLDNTRAKEMGYKSLSPIDVVKNYVGTMDVLNGEV